MKNLSIILDTKSLLASLRTKLGSTPNHVLNGPFWNRVHLHMQRQFPNTALRTVLLVEPSNSKSPTFQRWAARQIAAFDGEVTILHSRDVLGCLGKPFPTPPPASFSSAAIPLLIRSLQADEGVLVGSHDGTLADMFSKRLLQKKQAPFSGILGFSEDLDDKLYKLQSKGLRILDLEWDIPGCLPTDTPGRFPFECSLANECPAPEHLRPQSQDTLKVFAHKTKKTRTSLTNPAGIATQTPNIASRPSAHPSLPSRPSPSPVLNPEELRRYETCHRRAIHGPLRNILSRILGQLRHEGHSTVKLSALRKQFKSTATPKHGLADICGMPFPAFVAHACQDLVEVFCAEGTNHARILVAPLVLPHEWTLEQIFADQQGWWQLNFLGRMQSLETKNLERQLERHRHVLTAFTRSRLAEILGSFHRQGKPTVPISTLARLLKAASLGIGTRTLCGGSLPRFIASECADIATLEFHHGCNHARLKPLPKDA